MFMTKKQLRKALQSITNRYSETVPDDLVSDDVETFVACLNHTNLAQYLLETEMVRDISELEAELPKYQSAQGIVGAYQEMYEILEYVGCVEMKPPNLRLV